MRTAILVILSLLAPLCHAQRGTLRDPVMLFRPPTSSAAPASWNPTNLGGIAFWLSASNGITTNASGAVTNWVDTTGQVTFTNQSSTKSPTNIPNDRVVFNGTSSGMSSTATLYYGSNFWVCAVCTNAHPDGNGGRILNAAYNGYFVLTFDASSRTWGVGGGMRVDSFPYGQFIQVNTNTQWVVLMNVSNGVSKVWGLTNSSSTWTMLGAGSAQKFDLGWSTDLSGYYLKMGLKSLIFGTNAISTRTNIDNVLNWASNTFGLTP